MAAEPELPQLSHPAQPSPTGPAAAPAAGPALPQLCVTFSAINTSGRTISTLDGDFSSLPVGADRTVVREETIRRFSWLDDVPAVVELAEWIIPCGMGGDVIAGTSESVAIWGGW